MSFTNTFKWARRLAQAHLVAFGLLLVACGDTSSPLVESSAPTAFLESAIPGSVLASATGLNTHEPAGYTPLTDRRFDAKVENGWRDRGNPSFKILTDATAPASPSNVGQASYKSGFKGGTSPINTWFVLNPRRSKLYVSFWVKFSSNWIGHPSAMNKIMHFWIGGTNRVVFKAMGIGNKPLAARFHLQGVNHVPSSYNLTPTGSNNGNLSRGNWHQVEISVTANTGSNADGKITWWVDGQLVGDYSNLSFVTSSLGHTFTQVSWSPTWGGIGGILSQSQDMEMDHLYVSGL